MVGWLFAYPLAALGCAILLLASKRGARVLPWAPVVTSLAGLGWALAHPARAGVEHLGNMVRTGQLDVRCDLVLDRGSAALAFVSAVVVASVAFRKDARSAAGVVALGAASSVAILSDDLLVAGLAWALVALGAGASVARERLADAAWLAGGAVLFWGLGGAFTSDGYAPSLQPRVAALLSGEEATPAARSLFDDDDDDGLPPVPAGAKATLTVTALPGAEIYVDESRVALGGAGHPIRSPFADVPIAAGYHAFRVHPGQALDDFMVPQLRVEPGQRVTLLGLGPTLSSLDAHDQLALREGTRRPRAEALAGRTLFGAPLLTLSGALLAAAVFLRRGRGPLAVLVAVSGVAVFARHAHLGYGAAVLVGAALVTARLAAERAARAWTFPRPSAHLGTLVAMAADGVAELDWRVLGGAVDLLAFATRGFAWVTAAVDLRTLEAPPTAALLRMPPPPRASVLAVTALVIVVLSFVLVAAVRS